MSESPISDLASKCIRCGFCLESCPTYLETGQETESPRGRIYLIKSADLGQIGWEDVRSHLDLCLGCRGCETACPSGVEYGNLLELARQELKPTRAQKLATEMATRPTMLRLQLALAQLFGIKKMPKWLEKRLSNEDQTVQLPTVQNPQSKISDYSPHAASVREIAFLDGCAMRVLFPGVHTASKELLLATGHAVSSTDLGCCGALHAHAGMLEKGHKRADQVRQRADGKPVVTNSAGCGSWLKECGVPTLDLSEAIHNLDLSKARWAGTVTYHDACHLAHGQGIRKGPRDLIQSVTGVHFVELDEADLCCGSAGTYNLTEPKMARRLLKRKWANIEQALQWHDRPGHAYQERPAPESASAPPGDSRAGRPCHAVVLGNPGCHAWIAQAAREHGGQIRVLHLADFLKEAMDGYDPQL